MNKPANRLKKTSPEKRKGKKKGMHIFHHIESQKCFQLLYQSILLYPQKK